MQYILAYSKLNNTKNTLCRFLKRSPDSRTPVSENSETRETSGISEFSDHTTAARLPPSSPRFPKKFDFCTNLLDYLVKITNIKHYIGSLICCNFASCLHSKQFDKNNLRILTL